MADNNVSSIQSGAKSFIIFTDTSSNLTAKAARKMNIEVIPLPYSIDGVDKTCCDSSEYDAEEFFGRLSGGARVITSQISPQTFISSFEPYLKSEKDILYISMSSGISGTYNSAVTASKQLKELYPEREIAVFDSLAASLGEGLIAIEAAKLQRLGKTLRQTVDAITDIRERLYQVFTVDDLMYLKRGGRLSGISAGIGTVLSIKPILKGNSDGKIVAFSKVRGRKKSIEALADRYERLVENQALQTVYIAHCACRNDAEELAGMIQKRKPPKNFMITDYEPVTGSYVGTGALALFFLSDYGCKAK